MTFKFQDYLIDSPLENYLDTNVINYSMKVDRWKNLIIQKMDGQRCRYSFYVIEHLLLGINHIIKVDVLLLNFDCLLLWLRDVDLLSYIDCIESKTFIHG